MTTNPRKSAISIAGHTVQQGEKWGAIVTITLEAPDRTKTDTFSSGLIYNTAEEAETALKAVLARLTKEATQKGATVTGYQEGPGLLQ